MGKLKFVYCGTPDFSVPTLKMLFEHADIDLKYVISMPDRPAGRGKQLKSPEVIEFAKENNIPYFQTTNINKEDEFLNELEQLEIDAICVLAFAQFLGDRILNLPKLACFNIHTSLLPKYRGAAPIQYALLNGDKETGVSIQKMVKKMDAGNIVHEHKLQISDNETGGELYDRLKKQAAISMSNFITEILENNITEKVQDESQVSFAPTLKRKDGHLKFAEKNYNDLHNQVRALLPWPGTYCFLNDKRLKVFAIERSDEKLSPGKVSTKSGFLNIGIQDGAVRIKELQLEGKKRCLDIELLNGLRGEICIQ